MITPITRKELYLAKIIGEDVDIPETAKTREELFFLKILDNFSKIPEPITREELFLAKISGQDVELPEPKTRLELFLAKAAGVEIETPTPITREEIFWSNYSAIVDFEVEGVPPLTYKAIEGTLENYRIYGNTVDGESVGDRTGNLFDINNLEDRYDISSETGLPVQNSPYSYNRCAITTPINVSAGDYYLTFNKNIAGEIGFIVSVFENNTLISRTSGYYSGSRIRISSGNNIYIGFRNQNVALAIHPSDISNIMLNSGSTPLPYEPYGYKVPVTVEGKNLLQNIATSQTINGVTFTVNDDKSITVFGELTDTSATFVIANSSGIPGSYDHNSAIIPKDLTIIPTTTNNSIPLRAQHTDDTYKGTLSNDTPYTLPKDIGRVYITVTESLSEPVTIYPMIRKAYIEDDTYEPYRTPVTTSIYLSEQIKKVGDEAEYVDLGEQKQHFADGTSIDVALPALLTLSGTNTLSVGTEVQPSKVYIKGQKERD